MSATTVSPDNQFFVDVSDQGNPDLVPILETLSPTPASFMEDIYANMTMAPEPSFVYNCINNTQEFEDTCPVECTSLDECQACECQIVRLQDTGGPWGEVMDVILCLLPIIYLLFATIKPNPTPTTTSLPLSAVMMFLVRTMYLGSNPLLTSACVILGAHEGMTPLSIMAGAITLFETMEATKCLPYMMREMKALTGGHKVAEIMLLYGFATLVEGASGFGTPVALGAPMLVSTGNPPLESVVIMLVLNTFATVWGAVGTPLWFGFGSLPLSEDDFLEISMRCGVGMIISAYILIPFTLTVLIPFAVVKKNIIFLFLSIGCVMGPLLGLSIVNYEFPSLIGGLVGCGLVSVLVKFKVGLAEQIDEDELGEAEGGTDEDGKPIIGYQKAIADLTEIPLPLNASASAPAGLSAEKLETTAEQSNDATNTTQEKASNNDNNDDDDNSKVSGSITGNWNVEVQKDNAEAPEAVEVDNVSRTVVYVAPTTASTADGGDVEAPADTEAKSVKISTNGEPTATERVATSATASMKASATAAEDALLGPRKSWKEGYLQETILRTFPIWAVVLILILTRVSAFQIKPQLTRFEPYGELKLGTYGDFRISVSAVFQLRNILSYPNLNWKYELFYVPFLIPFVLISCITMIIYRKDMTCGPLDIANTVVTRLSNPAIAITGALILVQLMIRNGVESPAYLLGVTLAGWLKQGFVVISPLLGALGSFFSGSTTVSNLTFGEIQYIAAESIGINPNSMLALQALGASAGNGICLNNIIAALAVVGLNVSEGQILMKTSRYVFASTTIAMLVMLAIFIRF